MPRVFSMESLAHVGTWAVVYVEAFPHFPFQEVAAFFF